MDLVQLAAVTLPPGTHATVLGGRDVCQVEYHYVVVWADLPSGWCPRCGQQVAREAACPVQFNAEACAGGQLVDWDQTHGCGLWLSVPWTEVGQAENVTAADVLACAQVLADDLRGKVADLADRVEDHLRRSLREAMARLAEPLEDGETLREREAEITTGNEATPGVYREPGGPWLAWDFHPASSGPEDTITVYADGEAGGKR